MTESAAGALSGIKVVDLSRFIAGPLCCQILGDMGADVIKVERPGGEDARRHVPFKDGESVYTMVFNRNKMGITLDTRRAEADEILVRLVKWADVVVENYRPGTLERMGMPFSRMQEINPRVILTSISGFGQTGPNRERVLFDAIAQAESGLMSLTGKEDAEPTLTGAFISDYISAFHGVMGTQSALFARQSYGRGQHIDIACFDALFSCLGTGPSAYAMLGTEPKRSGSRDQITVPANVYGAKDGYVYIHGGTNALFPRLAKAMAQPELAFDERFVDQTQRLANVDEVDRIVGEWTAGRSVEEILQELIGVGVPVARVASVPEAARSEQVISREMLVEVEHPTVGSMILPGIATKMGGTPGSVRKPPPTVGEDNEIVYEDLLGYEKMEIAQFRATGVI